MVGKLVVRQLANDRILKIKILLYHIDTVEFLPCKQFHVDGLCLMVMACEGLLDYLTLASHVAIGCCLAEHRLAQFQAAFNSLWTKVEECLNPLGYLSVAHCHTATSVSIDVDIHWLGHTDGIAYLNEHLVGHTSCHHVLGYVACSVGS